MTVHTMERSMDADELRNWSIYFANESPDPQELQMAVLSNMIASYMGVIDSKYTIYLIRKQVEPETKAMSNSAILAVFQTLGAK